MSKIIKKGRAVVVTTEYGGVFFGYLKKTMGDNLILENVRNCMFWHDDMGGFMGLAAYGPNSKCKIGATCDSAEIKKVTSILNCSLKAERNWTEIEVWGIDR